jgi:hypothetical protein
MTTTIASARLFVDEQQLAPLIGVSIHFLRKDRRTARRIPFVRLGDRILYDVERVKRAMLELEEGGPTPESPRNAKAGTRDERRARTNR